MGRKARQSLSCRREDFERGVNRVRRQQVRIGDGSFTQYEFVMPSVVHKCVKPLKRYFTEIDRVTTNDRDPKNVYRLHPHEFYETALNVLFDVRNQLSVRRTYILGSSSLCGIAWAKIGVFDEVSPSAKFEFRTFADLIRHYNCILSACKDFGILNLYRSTRVKYDRLTPMSNQFDVSHNRMMSIAMLFLYDIVCNAGPDCREFREVFTNDVRTVVLDHLMRKWQPTHMATIGKENAVIMPSPINHKQIIRQIYNSVNGNAQTAASNTKFKNAYAKSRCLYSEVEIIDVLDSDFLGEEQPVRDMPDACDLYGCD